MQQIRLQVSYVYVDLFSLRLLICIIVHRLRTKIMRIFLIIRREDVCEFVNLWKFKDLLIVKKNPMNVFSR